MKPCKSEISPDLTLRMGGEYWVNSEWLILKREEARFADTTVLSMNSPLWSGRVHLIERRAPSVAMMYGW